MTRMNHLRAEDNTKLMNHGLDLTTNTHLYLVAVKFVSICINVCLCVTFMIKCTKDAVECLYLLVVTTISCSTFVSVLQSHLTVHAVVCWMPALQILLSECWKCLKCLKCVISDLCLITCGNCNWNISANYHTHTHIKQWLKLKKKPPVLND